MTVSAALAWLLSALFWVLITLCQIAVWILAWFVFRLFAGVLWVFWPLVLVGGMFGLVALSAQPAEAGWFSWLWGDSGSDIRKIERSAELAQEAARVTSEAARAHAEQAAAHAQQNARVAELLGQLSGERQGLADHLEALGRLGLQDSQFAAALGASGPVLVCLTALLVGGLALWLANRESLSPEADLAHAVDILAEELACSAAASSPFGLRVGGLAGVQELGQAPRSLGFLGGNLGIGNGPAPDGPDPDSPHPDTGSPTGLLGPGSGDSQDEPPMPF